MGFLVTGPKWSDFSTKDDGLESTISCTYQVSGTDGTRANPVNSLTASGLPLRGQPFSLDLPWLKCTNRTAKPLGVDFVEITCEFAIKTNNGDNNKDPLAEPPVIGWNVQTVEYDTDRDVWLNPIVNNNRDIIRGGKHPVNIYSLTVTKNLPSFSLATGRQNMNTVNDDDFTVCSFPVPKGYGRCSYLFPAKEVKLTDEFIPVRLTIDIFDESAPADPWQHRFLNQGSNAYYSGGKGRIVWKNSKQPVTQDVLLDNHGVPIDSTDLGIIRNTGETVATSFSNTTWTPPTHVQLVTASSVWYLIYEKYKQKDWAPMIEYLGLGDIS